MSRRTSPAGLAASGGGPFRADHVGSLLRPPRLLQAREDFAAGRIDADGLRAVEDEAIPDAVRMQEEVGLQSATDGEFRRASWHMDFIYQLGGISQADGTRCTCSSTTPRATSSSTPAALRVDGKIRSTRPIFGDDFTFLQSQVTHGGAEADDPVAEHGALPRRPAPRSTRPSTPTWRSSGPTWPPPTPTRSRRLDELGCTYLQFDDTSLAYLNDPAQRAEIAERGEDAEHMHLRYIKQINAAVAGQARGHGRHHAHVPRQLPLLVGGRRAATTSWPRRCSPSSPWTASSWSTTTSGRAGSSRCGSCRKGKMVVLGLVTTKRPELESKDDLKRRIDEAAKFVPLDQLCLSPPVRVLLHGRGQRADLRRAGRQAAAHRRDRPRGLGRLEPRGRY